jgi:hypothetical protein
MWRFKIENLLTLLNEGVYRFWFGKLYVFARFWFKHTFYNSCTFLISFQFLKKLWFFMNMLTTNWLLQNVWPCVDVLVNFPFLHNLVYKHYKKTRFFLLGKLVKRYPKWPLSNLSKVSSWTSCFRHGHFDWTSFPFLHNLVYI